MFSWKGRRNGDARINILPNVHDQGNQGTCTSHAFIVVCESRIRLEASNDENRRLVELDTSDLIRGMGNEYDIYWAARFMMHEGVRARRLTANGRSVRNRRWSELFKIKTIRQLYHDTDEEIEEIKQYIRERGAVFASIYINRDFYAPRVQMPYIRDESIRKDCAHAIALVGYESEQRHWIFQNSFGTRWGDRGFGTIPYRAILYYIVPVFLEEEVLDHYQGLQFPNDPPPPQMSSDESSNYE